MYARHDGVMVTASDRSVEGGALESPGILSSSFFFLVYTFLKNIIYPIYDYGFVDLCP